MDCEWTPREKFPKRLYRVVNPNSACKFDYRTGFTAASSLRINFKHRNHSQLAAFYRSIEDHRGGERIASPYISTFADREEAEGWTLAAEALFGMGCYMAEIDVEHYYLRGKAMWYVQDIQERSWKIISQLGTRKTPSARGLCIAPRNSEWLVLHSIPSLAVVSTTTPDQIRLEQFIASSSSNQLLPPNPDDYYNLPSYRSPSPVLYHPTWPDPDSIHGTHGEHNGGTDSYLVFDSTCLNIQCTGPPIDFNQEAVAGSASCPTASSLPQIFSLCSETVRPNHRPCREVVSKIVNGVPTPDYLIDTRLLSPPGKDNSREKVQGWLRGT